MSADYVPSPQVLKNQDLGITFLKPAKLGKTADAFKKYSAATTTREYFSLGGTAADWRYDLKHKYVTFVDPDMRRRATELVAVRVLSEDSLLTIFSGGTSDASPTPVSGGDGELSLSDLASQALHYIYYFQPDHVVSKINSWLVDPGVHDAFANSRISQF